MSATNTTTNLGLSQFQNTDVPAWRTDYNGDMLKIDNAYAADVSGATALSDVEDTDYVKVYDTSALANKKALVGDIISKAGHFIAPVEPSSTAANSYSVGDQLVYANALYDVTASISVSDSLVVGTNIDLADDVSTAIRGIKSNESTRVLNFTSLACAAMTGNFTTKSDAKITADHVLADISFSKPSAITSDVTWTTSAGSFTLNGTCIDATCTANVTLIKKDN